MPQKSIRSLIFPKKEFYDGGLRESFIVANRIVNVSWTSSKVASLLCREEESSHLWAPIFKLDEPFDSKIFANEIQM